MEVLGSTWQYLLLVAVSTAGIYVAFVVLVRLVGQRSLASMSSFDFACVVALGAVLGRTALLQRPTLAAGVVALVTFVVLQGVLGILRRDRRFDRWINRSPVLLVHEGRLLRQNMDRAHVVEDEIRQRLRLAGVRRLDEVHAVVLERNGAVSVLRAGEDVDPWLLSDVAVSSENTGGPPST